MNRRIRQKNQKKKTQTFPQNFMDLVFLPNPELVWNKDKKGMIVLDMVHKGFFDHIAQKFFHKPQVSHISLDSYGTALWLALNETHTTSDIVCIMENTFPEEKERMLDRTVTFLRTLELHHFIVQKQ